MSHGAVVIRDRQENMEKILIVAVGGTIDKDYPKLTKGYAFEFGPDPAVKRIFERVSLTSVFRIVVPFQKDSTEMNDRDREVLKKICEEAKEDFILITHGTDTLIDTATYLGQSQRRKESNSLSRKRIALTGSLRPERFANTDAHFNVGFALGGLQLAQPGTTYVCMNGTMRPWNSVERCFETGMFVGPGEGRKTDSGREP